MWGAQGWHCEVEMLLAALTVPVNPGLAEKLLELRGEPQAPDK